MIVRIVHSVKFELRMMVMSAWNVVYKSETGKCQGLILRGNTSFCVNDGE